jgi:serpin B
MKTGKAASLAVMVLVSAVAVQAQTGNGEAMVAEGNNKFAIALYDKLRAEKGNLFFSPYSISTALAMTYAGARGQTQAQMADVLYFPVGPNDVNEMQFHSTFGQIIKDLNARGAKGDYELAVANALWGQKGYSFLKDYLALIETNYDGGLNQVDFVSAAEAARQTINDWVQRKTKDKIKDLIPRGMLNSTTRLVLTNAIYFKGRWARQFEKELTREGPFTLLDGQKIDVPMMRQTEEFRYMEAEDFQALEMPYVKDELSMIILLAKNIDGVVDLEKKLTSENLSRWLGELHKQKVVVSIPRFKMTEQFSLADTLRAMGMTDAFSAQTADFSGMDGKQDLFISAVVHKAFVDVNEEGTEAAAATGIGMAMGAAPQKMPVFRADHPFIFFIRDNNSGSILFIGRVMDPAQTK